MWKITVMVVGLAAVSPAGCVGPNPYRSVDLSRNLDQATIDRYESEWKALQPGVREEHMVQLEHSNWWPLGLIAYHRESSVTRKAGPNGPIYRVTSGHGFGPLSLLYTISTDASYTAKGERMNWMRFQSALTGCLMMSHETDAKLTDGREEESYSSHWVHHVVNIQSMHGQTYVSLFTLPNAVGVSVTGSQ
jgi:hypothetical protein